MVDTPQYITLVNEQDEITGAAEKLEVHQHGWLHRAFSILVYNSAGQLLIHRRADSKYHGGGLWTNTCCGHPNEGETLEAAIHRRLQEEMGFDCPLEKSFVFHYRAAFDNGLIENEIDHVYTGTFDGSFEVNPDEVGAIAWVSVEEVKEDARQNPEKYTVWFRHILEHPQF